jgi:hypothetical protein
LGNLLRAHAALSQEYQRVEPQVCHLGDDLIPWSVLGRYHDFPCFFQHLL